METTSKPMYAISPDEVTFREVTARKIDGIWTYTETGPWFKGGTVGELYKKFNEKIQDLKNAGTLSQIESILCNAAYAAELFINGIITEKILSSIDEGVAGSGRGMTPFIGIPKQEFILAGETLQIKMVIVDCFSYDNFCLIDENDRNL